MSMIMVYSSEEPRVKPRETRTVGMNTVMVTCAPKVMADTTQMMTVRRASPGEKISVSRTRSAGRLTPSGTVT
jgi:hypothetical protein